MSVGVGLPVAMGGLLVMSALFSASETALFSLEPLEVERRTKKGHVFAESLGWCLRNPRTLLLTILLSNLAANT
ncbi:MAG: CNNM domain-containing protein, partial [Planctomycetota bacterium]|nr:CNNM domain-containing protein [Planctomycetota bacterium]